MLTQFNLQLPTGTELGNRKYNHRLSLITEAFRLIFVIGLVQASSKNAGRKMQKKRPKSFFLVNNYEFKNNYLFIFKFLLLQYPRSGSKAMSIEREEEEERAKVSVNNGQYIHLNQKWVHSCHSLS